MRRRKFSREFKLEAVTLVKDRGVAVAQAARDLDLHENVLRKWIRELGADPQHAFPGRVPVIRSHKMRCGMAALFDYELPS
jgi:transposase